MERYILSILVQNNSGVLRRVCGLFSRRGYNIESLSVGTTEDEKISRITIVVLCDVNMVDQIQKQVSKLVETISVEILDKNLSVFRELVMIRVKTTTTNRPEIIELANIFRARIVDVAKDSMVFEITGDTSKVEALIELMKPYTILEIVRAGLTAIKRGNLS